MTLFSLGDALKKKLTTEQPIKKQVEAAMIIEYATEVLRKLLGDTQAIHAKPLFLKNRTLTITCSSSVVAQEIRLQQGTIVDQINQKIGKREVDRIRYLV